MHSKLRVLAIDDSETIRINLKHILNRLNLANYKICSDGDEGIESLEVARKENLPFDLIMCDWNMPKMQGIDVLKWVRAHESPDIKRTKFLMITSSDEKIRTAVDLGANNFISKPLDDQAIRRKIDLVFL